MTLQEATEAMARQTLVTFNNHNIYTISGIIKRFSSAENKFYYRAELSEHIKFKHTCTIITRLEDISFT